MCQAATLQLNFRCDAPFGFRSILNNCVVAMSERIEGFKLLFNSLVQNQ